MARVSLTEGKIVVKKDDTGSADKLKKELVYEEKKKKENAS